MIYLLKPLEFMVSTCSIQNRCPLPTCSFCCRVWDWCPLDSTILSGNVWTKSTVFIQIKLVHFEHISSRQESNPWKSWKQNSSFLILFFLAFVSFGTTFGANKIKLANDLHQWSHLIGKTVASDFSLMHALFSRFLNDIDKFKMTHQKEKTW